MTVHPLTEHEMKTLTPPQKRYLQSVRHAGRTGRVFHSSARPFLQSLEALGLIDLTESPDAPSAKAMQGYTLWATCTEYKA